ncbi:MAG: hypothetical protein ACOX4U_02570 [Anaerovoracaceae bacterium]|jgi:hypothetical protein
MYISVSSFPSFQHMEKPNHFQESKKNTVNEEPKNPVEQKDDFNESQRQSRMELIQLQKELEISMEEAKAYQEEMETLRKCIIIAGRIIVGDNVPHKDYLFLAENNPDLYEKAIVLRIEKEDPKDYKSITKKDGDDDNSAVDSPSSDSAPQLSTSFTASVPEIPLQLDITV